MKAQNNIKQHNLHLHFIPEARHFTYKVLLAACLHGFLLYMQQLDLWRSKRVGGASIDIVSVSDVILGNIVTDQIMTLSESGS